MERLTEKCWRNLDPWECCGQDKYCQRGCHDEGGCTNGCEVPKMYCKLAKYEDLEEQCIAENQCGLRELLLKWKAFFDDIAELYDYRKAKEQGLLKMFPCRVGDTVYFLWRCSDETTIVHPATVKEICIGTYMLRKSVKYKIEPKGNCGMIKIFYSCDWGYTIFLTREEAESALAEKGGA